MRGTATDDSATHRFQKWAYRAYTKVTPIISPFVDTVPGVNTMTDLIVQRFRANPFAAAAMMRQDPMALLKRMRREYGEIVITVDLPMMKSVAIFSAELAYEILVRQTEKFVKPTLAKRMLESSFGNGLFFSEGSFWRRQRKLAQPAFHHVRINAYADEMVRQTQAMIDGWDGTVDIGKEMHALTLIIVVNALFKTDVSGLTDRVGEAMAALGAAAGAQSKSIIDSLLPNWFPTAINRQKQHAVDIINPILYRMIAERRTSNNDKGDLLSMFLNAVDEETGERMSDEQVRDELMTMFIAGHETSAAALTWTLIELARHPEVEAKLQAEVDSVLAGRPPTLADLPRLPYTEMVVKEILRLYPPASFIARQPVSTFEYGGHTFNDKAMLIVVPYIIHRDERWYSDPDAFKPERFAGDFERGLPKCAYIPFGTGPRLCIGNGFAMLEMQLVLASIVQHFRLRLAPGARVEPSLDLTLSLKYPVQMTTEVRMVAPVQEERP